MNDEKKFDEITKAKHYNVHPSGVECIDVIKHHDFNIGSVIKYVWRHGLKGDPNVDALKDLKKARYYLEKAIELLGGEPQEEYAAEKQFARDAIARVRQMESKDFEKAFGNSKREDIAKAIEDLLNRGIDVSEPPHVVFVEGVDVVHKDGWPGRVIGVDWSGASTRGPIGVHWSSVAPEGAHHPDFGRSVSWVQPDVLALPASPVPVTLEEVPSRAVPVRPRTDDSTTAIAGDSPEHLDEL